MSGENTTLHCKHRICKYIDSFGYEKRYTTTSLFDASLSPHHSVLNNHPCCNPKKKEFCDPSFEYITFWKESYTNRMPHPDNKYKCKHIHCKRAFPTTQRRNSHSKCHHICGEGCYPCLEYATKQKRDSIKQKNIEDVRRLKQRSETLVDFPPTSKKSVKTSVAVNEPKIFSQRDFFPTFLPSNDNFESMEDVFIQVEPPLKKRKLDNEEDKIVEIIGESTMYMRKLPTNEYEFIPGKI